MAPHCWAWGYRAGVGKGVREPPLFGTSCLGVCYRHLIKVLPLDHHLRVGTALCVISLHVQWVVRPIANHLLEKKQFYLVKIFLLKYNFMGMLALSFQYCFHKSYLFSLGILFAYIKKHVIPRDRAFTTVKG